MSKEQIDTKNCKECLHFEACSKWTDFPKQIGFPVCRRFTPTNTPTYTTLHQPCESVQVEEMAKDLFCSVVWKDLEDGAVALDIDSTTENFRSKGYRKQVEGEWKKVSDKYPRYVCTACDHLYNNKEYKYCPNCGAHMKGEKE